MRHWVERNPRAGVQPGLRSKEMERGLGTRLVFNPSLLSEPPVSPPLSFLCGRAFSSHKTENIDREKDKFVLYSVTIWKVTKSTLMDPIQQSLQERITDSVSHPWTNHLWQSVRKKILGRSYLWANQPWPAGPGWARIFRTEQTCANKAWNKYWQFWWATVFISGSDVYSYPWKLQQNWT